MAFSVPADVSPAFAGVSVTKRADLTEKIGGTSPILITAALLGQTKLAIASDEETPVYGFKNP